MSEEIFQATVERIAEHCRTSNQPSVQISFHGGEPCLAGPQQFARWCRRLTEELTPFLKVNLSMQTNGTLIDDDWIRLFHEYDVHVGVSIDGPATVHDVHRRDHAGRGSHHFVERGIRRLRAGRIPHGVLCVISFGSDSTAIHQYIASLGVRDMTYLLPDYSHDTIGPVRERYGATPCADFLLPVFDDWWNSNHSSMRIEPFWTIARTIMGGPSRIDLFGNRPFGYVFVETDGAIEGLDVLRVCHDGCSATGLNVLHNAFAEIAEVDSLHRAAIFEGVPLPTPCHGCVEEQSCAGGYLPHRFSAGRGFDNASVWCADILAIYGHMRPLLRAATPAAG